MRKGSIVLVPFPFTDLSGHKVRLALVLHKQSKGEDVIVAFITSTDTKKRNPYIVLVEPSKQNGLKGHSTIRVDKIATLESKVVIGELGTLEQSYVKQVDLALQKLLLL